MTIRADSKDDKIERLQESLSSLIESSSEVSRLGARTGGQWHRLSLSLIHARLALKMVNELKED